jgi:uncharacterized protein YqcC (DUF446 family)
MDRTASISDKINEVKEELRQIGLWKKNHPDWVNDFEKITVASHDDFTDWLQFVYLPNLVSLTGDHHFPAVKSFIVPQAVKFFGEDVRKGKLLQLLIELDSL